MRATSVASSRCALAISGLLPRKHLQARRLLPSSTPTSRAVTAAHSRCSSACASSSSCATSACAVCSSKAVAPRRPRFVARHAELCGGAVPRYRVQQLGRARRVLGGGGTVALEERRQHRPHHRRVECREQRRTPRWCGPPRRGAIPSKHPHCARPLTHRPHTRRPNDLATPLPVQSQGLDDGHVGSCCVGSEPRKHEPWCHGVRTGTARRPAGLIVRRAFRRSDGLCTDVVCA